MANETTAENLHKFLRNARGMGEAVHSEHNCISCKQPSRLRKWKILLLQNTELFVIKTLTRMRPCQVRLGVVFYSGELIARSIPIKEALPASSSA